MVIAHLSGWNLSLGALVAAVLTALGIGWISRKQRVKEDTAIGVVFTGMFALGILLMSRTRSYRDLSHMLFGNILGTELGRPASHDGRRGNRSGGPVALP